MDDTRKLGRLERLLSVQRMKRIGSEAALAQAQEHEREARAAEEAAQAASQSAQAEWQDYVGRPGFSPEYSRALSSRVLKLDVQLQHAQASTMRKSEITTIKQTDWQQSEAQVRQTEASTRRMARKLERKREEARIAEIGERLTFAWSRL